MIRFLVGILQHPLGGIEGIMRFVRWQVGQVLVPYPVIYNFTEHSKVLLKKSMTGMTYNYYCKLQEFNDMLFVLHFLRENDLFVDIGANVGSYTLLASKEVGARSVSYEPIESTWQILEFNVKLNKIEHLATIKKICVGSTVGHVKFTKNLDTMNHVSINENEENTVEVPIDTLDNQLENENPILIKIDTEGYEKEVLKGAQSTLKKSTLQAIIVEINGSDKKYNSSSNEVVEHLRKAGFRPVAYSPIERKLTLVENLTTNGNTIFIKNIELIQERVRTAKVFSVGERRF